MYEWVSESHSAVSDSLWPHGLYSPWNSPGQNTGVGSLSLLQGIFPWGKLWTKWYKKAEKPNCHFWRAWSKSRVLCMPPAPNTTYGVVVSHPSGHTPTLTLWKEPAHPPNGEQVSKGTCYLSTLPSCCSSGLSKVLPEFLVWLLTNFDWLRKPRTLVSYSLSWDNPGPNSASQCPPNMWEAS